MNNSAATPPMVKRIAHVEGHRRYHERNVRRPIGNIENSRGNPTACFGTLADHAMASAMSEWFTHNDLLSMRQWCYVASRLDQEHCDRSSDQFSPGGKMLELLKSLPANHRELINWFARYDRAYDMERVEDRKTHDFWAYQALIALRGEWSRLTARCDAVLGDPPRAASELKYLIDYHFYPALARRDLGRMQEALRELVTPQALRVRAKDKKRQKRLHSGPHLHPGGDLRRSPDSTVARSSWTRPTSQRNGCPWTRCPATTTITGS